MAYRIEFLPLAEQDLEEISNWYADISPQLMVEFLAELQQTLEDLYQGPHKFQALHKKFRKTNLNRFPYKVIFFVKHNTIYIIALVHHKRSAQFWKERKYPAI